MSHIAQMRPGVHAFFHLLSPFWAPFLFRLWFLLSCHPDAPAIGQRADFQRDELVHQGHIPLRIMSIGAAVDSAGGEVRLDLAPGRAGRCQQALGMVQRDQRIVLGVDQQDPGGRVPGARALFLAGWSPMA
jgi:hypothetical protein